MLKAKNFLRMPLDELTTLKSGRMCVVNHWWAITENGEALFYKAYTSPQCNSDKRVLEYISNKRPITTRAVFLPFAFVPHNCNDYE